MRGDHGDLATLLIQRGGKVLDKVRHAPLQHRAQGRGLALQENHWCGNGGAEDPAMRVPGCIRSAR